MGLMKEFLTGCWPEKGKALEVGGMRAGAKCTGMFPMPRRWFTRQLGSRAPGHSQKKCCALGTWVGQVIFRPQSAVSLQDGSGSMGDADLSTLLTACRLR